VSIPSPSSAVDQGLRPQADQDLAGGVDRRDDLRLAAIEQCRHIDLAQRLVEDHAEIAPATEHVPIEAERLDPAPTDSRQADLDRGSASLDGRRREPARSIWASSSAAA
jgi:hypothetical protein